MKVVPRERMDETLKPTIESPSLRDTVIERSANETLVDSAINLKPMADRQSTKVMHQSSSNQSSEAVEDMIVALRTEMNEKFYELQQEMMFITEQNTMKIMMQMIRSSIPQKEMLEDILGNMEILNQTDHFVTSFYNLSEENKRLKEEIAALKSNK